jgi:hypothetical protein
MKNAKRTAWRPPVLAVLPHVWNDAAGAGYGDMYQVLECGVRIFNDEFTSKYIH